MPYGVENNFGPTGKRRDPSFGAGLDSDDTAVRMV